MSALLPIRSWFSGAIYAGAWCVVVGVSSWAGACAAEPGYSFAATPGKLPKTVVPVHYRIELTPDLDALSLAGSELVDIDVREPTAQVVLNALDLAVGSAAIEGDPSLNADITADDGANTVTLTFPQPLAVGAHQLRVTFTGKINPFGRGLFKVDYPTRDGQKRMMATHLEPADARRVFPSWDEPSFKATMQLTVTVPQSFMAVSNTPVIREQAIDQDRKRVSFAATPKMSTYLFVLTAGDLETLSGEADGVAVNVVTTRGKSAQGKFALDSAIKLLAYYNDYFGVKYPLPKLDLIAVPGGFGGAMENWGGIIFFESRLLFDQATASAESRRGIFGILAHEMAHQWFGDLVTMAWWDNLWLNEGFATWMQAKAADHFYPQWQVWLNSASQRQAAMGEDARRTSHPIQQPVAHESEALAAFDAITYSKGQAFIRMLENYLGEDAFRDGIRQYMQENAYGNTTSADLWRALESASGKKVAGMAARYTEQAGLPLVVAEMSWTGGRQRVAIKQKRFTVHDPSAAPRNWQVPIAVGPLRALAPAQKILLDDQGAEIDAGRCDEPPKLNVGGFGYFRVQYDAAAYAALTKSIKTMPAADRVSLLADSWALLEAGEIPPARYLELLDDLGDDASLAVWNQVIHTLTRVDQLQRGRSERAAFQAYARGILRPVFDRLGWDRKSGEPATRGQLRTRLIRALGDLGDADILAEARRQFDGFLRGPGSLRPALRDPVTHLVGRTADLATYEALLALARQATDATERVRYYFALASALDPALAKETLNLALTNELPSNLVGGVISWVASVGEQPDLAWSFVQENFTALVSKQGPPFRNYFASNLMANFSDKARATELSAFAPVHETPGGRIIADQAVESILISADLAARQLPAIDDWVRRRMANP